MKLSTDEILKKFSNGREHPNEVKRLSVILFDELNQKVKEMPERLKKLLEAAALLHDIGYYEEAKSHNKHSQAMILEYGLEGFSEEETKMIACIARYHRGSLPDKTKHDFYGSFEKKDRKIIKKLGGILRFADGLDSAHRALIKKISIDYDKQNEIIEILLTPEGKYLTPDITAAIRKRDLLEIGFKVQSVVKFVG